jgi:D-3-phosphoglycerate dehydrogenase
LFALPNVICTPHLGASTREAQENVALQIADQMSDHLLNGAVTNAVNFPSVTAAEAPRLKPYVTLATQLGSFAGQLTDRPIKRVRIEYVGAVAGMKVKVLTAAVLAGLLTPALGDGVNMVSASALAQARGITVEEALRDQDGALDNYVRLTIISDEFERSVAGAVFSDGRPRLIQIRGINMDVELTPHMLFVRNADRPGFIGTFGTLMGRAGVNIATFSLGRDRPGGDAICIAAVDTRVSDDLLREVAALSHVVRVNRLEF